MLPERLLVHCRYQAAKAELAGIETQMLALQQAQDSDTISISGVSNQVLYVKELRCADLANCFATLCKAPQASASNRGKDSNTALAAPFVAALRARQQSWQHDCANPAACCARLAEACLAVSLLFSSFVPLFMDDQNLWMQLPLLFRWESCILQYM